MSLSKLEHEKSKREIKTLDDKYAHLDTDKKRADVFGTSKETGSEGVKKVVETTRSRTAKPATEDFTIKNDLKLKIETYDKSVYI